MAQNILRQISARQRLHHTHTTEQYREGKKSKERGITNNMAEKTTSLDKQITCMAYIHRENNFRHHYYDEEMKQYELMKVGDPCAIAESTRMMSSNLRGHLSDDPVRNMKYLFVASVTIATRFAIEGGLDSETAYNISDLYINKMDALGNVDEILELHRDMFTYFTKQMANLKKQCVFSKPVIQCLDYIDLNLHTHIKIDELAKYVNLNTSYLSTLFKKEMGIPVSDYILNRRIDTAKNMLRYSEYPASQISEILAFSSQSHFIRCFKKLTGMTPKEYQKLHYRENLNAAHKHSESKNH